LLAGDGQAINPRNPTNTNMSSEKAVIKLEKLFKVIYLPNLSENYLTFLK